MWAEKERKVVMFLCLVGAGKDVGNRLLPVSEEVPILIFLVSGTDVAGLGVWTPQLIIRSRR